MSATKLMHVVNKTKYTLLREDVVYFALLGVRNVCRRLCAAHTLKRMLCYVLLCHRVRVYMHANIEQTHVRQWEHDENVTYNHFWIWTMRCCLPRSHSNVIIVFDWLLTCVMSEAVPLSLICSCFGRIHGNLTVIFGRVWMRGLKTKETVRNEKKNSKRKFTSS